VARNRQTILLWILAAVSAGAVYIWWPRVPDAVQAPAAARSAARPARGGATAPVPEVRLEALSAEHPIPDSANRNLFKFKPKPVPVPVTQVPRPVIISAPPPVPTGPPPPPPLPPITLKFIGVVEHGAPSERIAILSDGRGAPLYGKEGDAVLGQYKIVRIGTESIDMSYLDGRGRQTIRLSGS
jgi:hypothetical protein